VRWPPPRTGEGNRDAGAARHLGRARRPLVAAAVAAALAAAAAPAAASPGSDGDLCSDGCSAAAWQQAIRLPEVSGRWDGDGVTVASIDTGVTPGPDLGSRLLARVDFTADHDGIDRFGHGTHMAGLIAGDGSLSDGAPEGAAPGAGLVSVKVAGWDGATDASTVIAALQWVVANRSRYRIRVLSLSWGTDGVQSPDVDPLNAAVQRAWRAGIVVVVSSGNSGPGPLSVTKPGDDPFAITVGAADTGIGASPDDDAPAPFSAYGATAGGVQKPDLLGPGVGLVSGRAPASTIDTFQPEGRVGLSHMRGTGTSQAAAVVAGVVARMLEADPALSPDQVKAALLRSADSRLAGPAGGAGLLDAATAVAMAAMASPPDVAPQAGPASSGLGSLDGSRGGERIVADPDGDGVAGPVTGEVDALGLPWDPAAFAAAAWNRWTWPASPWAARVAEIRGSYPAPAWTGAAAPLAAWEATYWGARSPQAAGWDAKYWGAKYWGAKYWGAKYWGTAAWE
jgi:serine protease AprX